MTRPPENEIGLATDGLEKWAAVYDRLTITPAAGGMRRLAVSVGAMTIYEIFLTADQAAHLRALLASDAEAS
jgi:hypothetical protein